MEFKGKLYGKIGNKYFDTNKTSKDVDKLVEMLKKSKSTISRISLSMNVHPDCQENSEFADYVDLAIETESEIDELLKQF